MINKFFTLYNSNYKIIDNVKSFMKKGSVNMKADMRGLRKEKRIQIDSV
ncbi:hypothetical protein THER_2014 [Thermodesulfovibrio sp. N1]|nr:hypothetical protein THER_2014 [Thermodesulfovibrio sp. N1]